MNKRKTYLEQRICEHFDLGETENEYHTLFACPFFTKERHSLFTSKLFHTNKLATIFLTFKTILTMAGDDPDTLLTLFVAL